MNNFVNYNLRIMRKLSALTVILLFAFLPSCKKEVINPTVGEKTQAELENVIVTKNIKRVYAFDYPGGGWTTLPASAGGFWTFSNGYITIDGYAFNQGRNLAYLYSYNVANVPLDNGTVVQALLLYFAQ